MSEIRIGPGMQLLLLLAIVLGIGALVASMQPELRRYLNVRSM
jgi:hypothetical protein